MNIEIISIFRNIMSEKMITIVFILTRLFLSELIVGNITFLTFSRMDFLRSTTVEALCARVR